MRIMMVRSFWLLLLCFFISNIYAKKLPEEVGKKTDVHGMQLAGTTSAHTKPRAAQAANKLPVKYLAGEHYRVLDKPAQVDTAKSKIEVAEVFWYGCPHCYELESIVNIWRPSLPKDVEFMKVPAFFGPSLWKAHAQFYYTLQSMGVVEKVHASVFDEIQKKKNYLKERADMAEFVNTKFGIDKKKFVKSYSSIGIVHKLLKTSAKVRAYGLSGVPAIVVDGRFVVEPELAGSLENMPDITLFLVVKVRDERSAEKEKVKKKVQEKAVEKEKVKEKVKEKAKGSSEE